jgi:hypothetical protein
MLGNDTVANAKNLTLNTQLVAVAPLKILSNENLVVFPRHTASGSSNVHSENLHYYLRNITEGSAVPINGIEDTSFVISKKGGGQVEAIIDHEGIKIKNSNGTYSGFRNFPDIGETQITLLNLLERSITNPLSQEEYKKYLDLWSGLLKASSAEPNQTIAFQANHSLIEESRRENGTSV